MYIQQPYDRRNDLYHNIYELFTVLLTMNVSSASSERSLNTLRRITNIYEMFLFLLHFNRAGNISITEVIDQIVEGKKKKRKRRKKNPQTSRSNLTAIKY